MVRFSGFIGNEMSVYTHHRQEYMDCQALMWLLNILLENLGHLCAAITAFTPETSCRDLHSFRHKSVHGVGCWLWLIFSKVFDGVEVRTLCRPFKKKKIFFAAMFFTKIKAKAIKINLRSKANTGIWPVFTFPGVCLFKVAAVSNLLIHWHCRDFGFDWLIWVSSYIETTALSCSLALLTELLVVQWVNFILQSSSASEECLHN